ncbi:cytochrome P450 [Mycobacterium tuberculosis]|nr:cytochrome P450 [Mycobacterium tuberculosis]CME82703.1 cytochrome P450 [Mycobacterium tuberculosis]
MVYTGSDAGDHASAPQPSGSGSVPASVNVPGLVVAAVWAVGLVAGLVALTIGHLAVAAAALVVAVMAPWCRVGPISRMANIGSAAKRCAGRPPVKRPHSQPAGAVCDFRRGSAGPHLREPMVLRSLASPAALTDPKRCASVVGVAAFAVRREHAPDALGGPPGLPAPRGFRAAFAAAYAVAYLAGGERRMLRLIRRYGPIMTMPILSLGDVAIVSDSALAKEVFTAPTDVLLGGEGVGPAAAIYGSGSMFVQEEPEHLRRRKLLTPPLHGAALDRYVPIIENSTRAAMHTWPVDRPFAMLTVARSLMLDVIVKVIFGVDDPEEVRRLGRPFERLLNLGVSEQLTVRYALRRLGALRVWPARARANTEIDDVVMALIAQRRADPRLGERHDVLSLLVSARGESGEQLSDSEIRDDLITLVLAGHETTATTLAWAFDLLLHHPDALRRVRAEAVGGGEAFTTAVINETLRVRPPAPLTARVAAQPLTIGGYRVEAGTRIVVHIIAINRSAEVYEHPHEFRPERFLGTRPQTYAWVPFGGGVKRCLGANFSMRELITVLHVLLREGEFTAVDDEPERIVRRSIMLVPRRGTRVRFRPAR